MITSVETSKSKKGLRFSEKIYSWLSSYELYVMTFGSCCSMGQTLENFMRESALKHGLSLHFTLNPQEVDILVVAGFVTMKQLNHLQQLYEQIPAPKILMTVGGCVHEQGIFDSYGIVENFSDYFSINIDIPGCPPDRTYLDPIWAKIRHGQLLMMGEEHE